MSLPRTYLAYPHRRHGMDQDRYDWSILSRRAPVRWPGGARVALLVVPALEWFPLDMKGVPFKPPGAMTTPYPDLRHYTLRDYGNRVGIYRLMKLMNRFGLHASVAVNAAIAARHPSLVKACVDQGWEIMASGLDMDHLHHEGLDRADEQRWVEDTLAILRRVSGQAVRGWLSPARSESSATLDLISAAGIDYVCDWANDDLPYPMHTTARPLCALPLSYDMDDHTILVQNRHSEREFVEQVRDQFDGLAKEAEATGGRLMTLSLHPWVIGQPYRIGALEEALAHIVASKDVWLATASMIIDALTNQAGTHSN